VRDGRRKAANGAERPCGPKGVKRMLIQAKTIYRDSLGNTIEFVRVPRVPGFSHRVIYNGRKTKKWLDERYRPSKRTAEFFFELINKDPESFIVN
jgi:hypothetical protein